MAETACTYRESSLPVTAGPRREGDLWAIVLAGGEGVRLRSRTRELYGEERPKQYAVLTGSESLLRQTLDRVGLVIPPRRTVIVTLASHERYLAAELTGLVDLHVLPQPVDRGTAAGVLLPAHWIRARDPQATIVVFPSDHFILEEAIFMRHVAEAARYVRAHPEWLLLLGAQPTEPESDYGWIEPGERVGWSGRAPIHRIGHFREKPSEGLARCLLERGWLWSTFVFAASAATLVDAGLRCLPLLHDRFLRLEVFVGTRYASWALPQAYEFVPKADFSRAVLESSSLPLAVMPVRGLTWCDVGTPDRLARTLWRVADWP
jgi:mannose-1-phosphate guanylyltransferase